MCNNQTKCTMSCLLKRAGNEQADRIIGYFHLLSNCKRLHAVMIAITMDHQLDSTTNHNCTLPEIEEEFPVDKGIKANWTSLR